jgi:hypothetical protein
MHSLLTGIIFSVLSEYGRRFNLYPDPFYEVWKMSFLLLLSFKAASIILQFALSSSGVPLNPTAQRYAYALLVHC